jgi:hypothetical protein
MSWATSGGSAPSDANSGIAGLQYRIGPGGTWYGDSHNGTGDSSDLLANDGVYATTPTPDHTDLIEGINTVYFRTWDQAGNYTPTYATATIKINTSGAPSEPINLIATPSTNTSNSFGFNWDTPVTYVGNANNITYCYTVNTVPTVSACAYTAAGSTELTVGPYATQPGTNTLYVVAKDESGNINYSNFASVNFTANTPAESPATTTKDEITKADGSVKVPVYTIDTVFPSPLDSTTDLKALGDGVIISDVGLLLVDSSILTADSNYKVVLDKEVFDASIVKKFGNGFSILKITQIKKQDTQTTTTSGASTTPVDKTQ